jgi:hypothetical protein
VLELPLCETPMGTQLGAALICDRALCDHNKPMATGTAMTAASDSNVLVFILRSYVSEWEIPVEGLGGSSRQAGDSDPVLKTFGASAQAIRDGLLWRRLQREALRNESLDSHLDKPFALIGGDVPRCWTEADRKS